LGEIRVSSFGVKILSMYTITLIGFLVNKDIKRKAKKKGWLLVALFPVLVLVINTLYM